jgi:predicted RNase H-like HicB family nuclease
MTIQAEFKLFGTMKRERGWYIAYCPPLDIATQGRTVAEARKNLIEAAQLFLLSCLERGTLDRALKELGFVPSKNGRQRLPRKAFPLVVPVPLGFDRKVECPA